VINSLDEPNLPTRPPIFHWEDKPRVKLGPLGAESPMNDMESSIWQSLHAFAEKTMRPVGPAAPLKISPASPAPY